MVCANTKVKMVKETEKSLSDARGKGKENEKSFIYYRESFFDADSGCLRQREHR